MISTTTGPRSATQRKRQRLDQLVGRIAHLVGSAPIRRISSSSHNSGCGPVAKNKNRNNNIRSSNNIHNNNNNNNNNSGETEDGENERRGRICVSLSEEEEEEDEEEEDDDEEGSVSVSMESSVGSGESPSPQQQAVLSMSRLRMRGNMRHLHHHHHQFHHHHLHPHHGGGQVFSFDHVMPVMAAMAGSAAMCSQSQSDEEGEEEVFSPGLGLTPTFSDRLTLSPCSQSSTTVDSPSGISFSPLSFADCGDDAVGARGITRSLTSDPSTPLNLSTGGSRGSHHHAGVTPPNASSSPCHAGATKRCNTVGSSSDVEPNRRRARSDSDLCDTDRLVEDGRSHHHHHPMVAVAAAAAPASWVLTPATSSSLTSPPLSTGSSQHSSGHLAPRLSRLEHLRPPPLMVSLKRNSSDSTDSWSPLFGQQESPVDLSVRSGSSISSDSPNQTSTNTSTASVSSAELSMFSGSGGGGLETPPPPTSSRVGKSRGSRLKVLTRSLSLSQYLSAEYSSSSVDLSGPDSESVSPIMTTPLLLPGSNLGFGCEICGQVFDHHDRLIKHLTSRHKLPVQQQHQQHHHHQQQQTATIPPPPPPPTTPRSLNGSGESGVVVKGYQCDVCQRPFARSDMLTRHMRLHTGLKPYTCRICGQVFSRSDHLSTHQRTHTGEKPYRCPQCSYAACRRDMITRHLRTHTRSEDLDGLNDPRKDSG